MSNKMQRFSFKGECGVCRSMHIEVFKGSCGFGYRNGFTLIVYNIVLFKTVIATTQELKNY